MKQHKKYKIKHFHKNKSESIELNMICEEPLLITIQGNPYSVVMRTPGDEEAHVAGFCYTDGLIEKTHHIKSMNISLEKNNKAEVILTKERYEKINHIIQTKGFIKQTSSALMPGNLCKSNLSKNPNPIPVKVSSAYNIVENLRKIQPIRKQTAATHAAALYDKNFDLLSVAEDVGRHNAFDKVIGRLFLKDKIDTASIAVLSSRVSSDLVQKANRAGISCILSVSRPTSLAIDMAKSLNISLACLSREGGLFVYWGNFFY